MGVHSKAPIFLILILMISNFEVIFAITGLKDDSEILQEMLSNYDKLKFPSNDSYNPVNVSIAIHIEQVAVTVETHSTMELDFFIRQHWEDPRLQFGQAYYSALKLPRSFADMIWKPDLSFENARSFKPKSTGYDADGFLAIFPDGRVILGSRAHLKTYCHLDLTGFPFDKQMCQVKMQSYKYTSWVIDLFWDAWGAATYANNIRSDDFSLLKVQPQKGLREFSSGSYAELRLEVHLGRRSGYYVMTFHFPAFVVAMTSCVALWIRRDQIAARTAIGIVAIYATLLLHFIARTQAGKQQSFYTTLDVYLLFTLLFVSVVMVTSLYQSHCEPLGKQTIKVDEDDSLHGSGMSKKGKSLNDIIVGTIYPLIFFVFMGIYFLIVM